MHILHTESSKNWGGQEYRILEQVRWCNENGHRAWVAAREDAAIFQRASQWGLPRIAVPFRGSANPAALWRLAGAIRKYRIDVVDCHSSRDATHAAIIRPLRARVVRSVHITSAPKTDPAHRAVWHFGNDRIIATADAIRAQLEAAGIAGSRIDVVGEGIDCAEFDYRRSGERVRAELELPPSVPLVVNIGMIRPDKGQQFFVEAAERLATQFPRAKFLIVGSGTRPEHEAALAGQIGSSPYAERILMAGYRDDIPDIIAAADCVVVASTAVEAQSRIVPQCFAMKTPVVATRTGGLPELVRPGVTGWLVPAFDGAAIADAVTEVLGADTGPVTATAYALAMRDLCSETMMAKTLDSYTMALGDAAPKTP